MTRWLLMGLPALSLAAPAAAGAGFAPLLLHPMPEGTAARLPSLRVVQSTEFEPIPVRRSGVIVDALVVPQGRLGLGLFTTTPRRPGAAEWRLDAKPQRSRRAGVSFRLAF